MSERAISTPLLLVCRSLTGRNLDGLSEDSVRGILNAAIEDVPMLLIVQRPA